MDDADSAPVFDIVTALSNQADLVSERAARLSALKRAVDAGGLEWMEWLLLFAAAVEYRPDLIVELGRWHGNSTCALTEAATVLGGCRVRSYDVDGERAYETVTLPAIRPLVAPDWLARQEIIHKDITQEHPDDLLRGGRRVLLFWDAHGPAVARHVLARFAPALAGREHLIVVHDIVDTRYAPADHDYVTAAGQPTWWRSHLMSICEELDPLFDFVSRNGIRLHTAGRSAWRRCPDAPALDVLSAAVRSIVGSALDLFSDPHSAEFAYFSCGDRTSTRPLVFPEGDDWDRVAADVTGQAVRTSSVELDLADFRPNSGTIGSAPDGGVRIVTPPVPWGYAATLPLPTYSDTRSGAVRIRAELTGGAVGVGVLTADGKGFVDRKIITSLARTVEVFLNIPQLSLAGDLVVQTWDRATSGTVRLEGVTLIVRDRVGQPAEGSIVR